MPAFAAIIAVVSVSSEICLDLMPVLVKIHSSEVSKVLARSSFVTIFLGKKEPVEAIAEEKLLDLGIFRLDRL